MNAKKRFYIELPEAISLAEAKFELWVNGENFEAITAEILDNGGGAYLKLSTESAALDPEELRELTDTLLDTCKFIDNNKLKGKK